MPTNSHQGAERFTVTEFMRRFTSKCPLEKIVFVKKCYLAKYHHENFGADLLTCNQLLPGQMESQSSPLHVWNETWKLLSTDWQLHKQTVESSDLDTTAVSLNDHFNSQFSNNGRVSRQGLRWQVVVAVRAVQEGLPALAMARLVGM